MEPSGSTPTASGGDEAVRVFMSYRRTDDIKVLRWTVAPDGAVSYVDNRGERDHVFPPSHGPGICPWHSPALLGPDDVTEVFGYLILKRGSSSGSSLVISH